MPGSRPPGISPRDAPDPWRVGTHGDLRVVVAHGLELHCAALAALVRTQPDLALAGTSTDPVEAARLAGAAGAEILILDTGAGDRRYLAAIDAVAAAGGPTRVLLLGVVGRSEDVLEALRRGAWGALPVNASPDILFKSIRAAAAGEAWVDRQTVTALLQELHHPSPQGRGERPPSAKLTRRELEIVRALAAGASNRDIGGELGMGPQTVKNHLSTIYDKVGVSSRLELALYALHHGLAGSETDARLVPKS